MNTAFDPQIFEQYLQEVQELKIISTQNPQKLKQLLDHISKKRESFDESSDCSFLFKAEHAFHNGHFEQALANYMQARQVPFFEFFCYRATAYISFLRKDYKKAVSFINKALDFRPYDYDTLKLYHEILVQQGEQELAAEIKNQTRSLEEGILNFTAKEDSKTHDADELSKKRPGIMDEELEEHKADDYEESTMIEDEPAGAEPLRQETTSRFIATNLGVDLDTEKALEERIHEFQKKRTKHIQDYLEESKRKRKIKDHCLHILSGWNSVREDASEGPHSSAIPSKHLLMDRSLQHSGGIFVRWNGMGIAINPGLNFLENFHRQGLYLTDIHFVIVTQDSPDAYGDIQRIYDLNYQLNKISPELHVIHYYLNHKAYQDLSHTLKPNFKQERNTVHSLELFLDSPDVEKEELSEGILLNYFSTTSRGGYRSNPEFQDSVNTMQGNAVGIRIDLSDRKKNSSIKLGYVTGTSWSPLLAHNLGHCDILISGFGTTNPNDYGKLNYNENSLGYFGTYTLFEEVKPKLLLCTEFDGREGDIRLEVAKKLRTEFRNAHSASSDLPTVLPADIGLYIDLRSQSIECSISKALLDPSGVHVVKTSGTYGNLQYLSPACIL